MLNKELLLDTESQIAGHVKITVEEGEAAGTFGYIPYENAGSMNRIPTWNKNGDPIKVYALFTDARFHYSAISLYNALKADADSITMTVVEKGLTVVLNWDSFFYRTTTEVFDSSDLGKTFTLVFDLEPTGYVWQEHQV